MPATLQITLPLDRRAMAALVAVGVVSAEKLAGNVSRQLLSETTDALAGMMALQRLELLEHLVAYLRNHAVVAVRQPPPQGALFAPIAETVAGAPGAAASGPANPSPRQAPAAAASSEPRRSRRRRSLAGSET